jgi:carboxypeptidase C (cathepsin A)
LTAISLFLVRHSNLIKNPLYIAGSGYGAIYAARLARLIIDKNRDQSIFNIEIKIKGILLGNPCVNPDECFSSGT